MFFGPPKQGSPPSPLSTTEARSEAASKRSEFATVSGSPIGVLRSAIVASNRSITIRGESSTM